MTQEEKKENIYEIIHIDIDSANQRFDRFLRKFYKPYTNISLASIYERIRKWYIQLNDKKGKEDTKVMLWDKISINITKTIPLSKKALSTKTKQTNQKITEEQAQASREKIKKHIVLEDTKWVVFNKPPHMLMHPWSGRSKIAITMNDRLYSYLNKTNQALLTAGSTFKPAFCFRLDKDTSGILIASKTYEALQYLNGLIRDRQVDKYYITVVAGKLPNKLVIKKPLFKWFHWEKWKAHMFVNYEKGLPSETHVYNIATIQDPKLWDVSLWLVHLLTWRMHQIRVHLVSEWFPILGDREYGSEQIAISLAKSHKITRQLLHSFFYSFIDTDKKKKEFVAPIPDDIKQLFPNITEDLLVKRIKKSIT